MLDCSQYKYKLGNIKKIEKQSEKKNHLNITHTHTQNGATQEKQSGHHNSEQSKKMNEHYDWRLTPAHKELLIVTENDEKVFDSGDTQLYSMIQNK